VVFRHRAYKINTHGYPASRRHLQQPDCSVIPATAIGDGVGGLTNAEESSSVAQVQRTSTSYFHIGQAWVIPWSKIKSRFVGEIPLLASL
jgi:hypothetical protein